MNDEREVQRLEDLKPSTVALVDRPANMREWIVVKSADGTAEVIETDAADVKKVVETVEKAADAHKALLSEIADAMKSKVDAVKAAAESGKDRKALREASDGFWDLMDAMRKNAVVVGATGGSGEDDTTGNDTTTNDGDNTVSKSVKKNDDDPKNDDDKNDDETANKGLDANLRAAGEKLLKAAGELQKNADADVSADVSAAIDLLKKFSGDGAEKAADGVIKAQADVLGEKSAASRLRKAATMILGLNGVEKAAASTTAVGISEAVSDLVKAAPPQGDNTRKIGSDQMAAVVDAVNKLTGVMKSVGVKTLSELADVAKREISTEATIVAKSISPFVAKAAAVSTDVVKRLERIEQSTAISKALGAGDGAGVKVKKNQADWSFLV